MTYHNFFTTMALWAITTTLTFTNTVARYIIHKDETTTTTILKDNGPSIWKQRIYCLTTRIFPTPYELANNFAEIEQNHKLYKTEGGRFFYVQTDCKTYGPLIIIGSASIIVSALLFKLWKTYQQTTPTPPSSFSTEQKNILTSPIFNLQQECAFEDKQALLSVQKKHISNLI